MAHIWLQAIHGQDHPTLLFKDLMQALLLMQMHRDQLFVAMQRMFYGPFTDLHPSLFQMLMDFFDASMLSVAQHSYQCNHIESTFSMGQGKSAFFFWAVGSLITGALSIATSTDHQC